MEQLLSAYKKGNVILFVGAGVSMNLGLPSWSELINHISVELGYDPDIYKTFGNDLALAEYYRIEKGRIGPLRSWMDTQWHSGDVKLENSKVHEYIAKANFPLIYTTNYDRWIEKSLKHYGKEFIKIASVSDMTDIRKDLTQVIKFHGDFDDDESIVLDETSYFERLEFESPLDLKLRADVLGKTVLFIGYSLSDINIRLLFYKLSKLWKGNYSGGVQPKSYVFSPRPNPVQEAVLEQWGINMINSEIDDSGKALEEFLKQFI
ncbi:SIR2 family protein [Vibrio diazotrophicus]|uniref:SIR2 family NAD-dependent protein deacylase n=1 Tax=Vibrio diazotrophicus TaxID=685 RepID=UPI0022AFE04F|nr:SIR2 family protein [Vibrio diazotrophicus]MCZ4374293.1 SIR2 family protein [Vibrio diazotrophicus]